MASVSSPGPRSPGPKLLFYHFDSDKGRSIIPEVNWCIFDLKSAIHGQNPNCGVTVDTLRVVYQGNELGDNQQLIDCNLQDSSTVHILKSTRSRDGPQATRARPQNQFYVYCSECKTICEGRILVKCAACDKQSFVVKEGPKSWDEVLVKKMALKGDCLSESCRVETREGKYSVHCGAHKGAVDPPMALPLPLLRTNTVKVKCMKCASIDDPVIVFPCIRRHSLCVPCLEVYANMSLNNMSFIKHPESDIYTLGCPANCPDSFIPEVHYFKAVSLYERYKEIATKDFVLSMGGVICDCGNGILCEQFEVSAGNDAGKKDAKEEEKEDEEPKEEEEKKEEVDFPPGMRPARKMSLQCDACQKVYCTRCKKIWHGTSACDGPSKEDRPKDVFEIEKQKAEAACWRRDEFDPFIDAIHKDLKLAKETAMKSQKKKWKWWPF